MAFRPSWTQTVRPSVTGPSKRRSIQEIEKEWANNSPEEAAGSCCRYFFLWSIPFFRHASTKLRNCEGLELDGLPAMPSWEEPLANKRKMERLWAEEMNKKSPSLARTMVRFMGTEQLLSCFGMQFQVLFQAGASMLAMSVVQEIAELANNPSDSSSALTGYVSSISIALCQLFAGLCFQCSWHVTSSVARRFWCALSAMIFEKPALLSSSARASISEGDLVNMIQQDAQQTVALLQFIVPTTIWPAFLIVSSGLLFYYLGWPFIVGFVMCIVAAFLCERVADYTSKYMRLRYFWADRRTKTLNETLQGIKTVKFAAWEEELAKRIDEIRNKELNVIWWLQFWQNASNCLSYGVPLLGLVATFLIYEATGGKLEAGKTFACVGLFEILTYAVSILPFFCMQARNVLVNLRRIQRLLGMKNEHKCDSGSLGSYVGRVSLADVCFAWNKEAGNTLEGLSLSAEPGQLITVCGRVGSGKTTFAAGVLSLADLTSGKMSVNGRTSYVPQNAQILNTTVRENILFGMEYDEERYNQVIEACALQDDLKQFVNGDDTEIGEKGVTISGGQKQRVSIARAVYANADIIVLDDPLSAMDAHVGSIVFNKCISGMLAGKTRIFCTNQLQFCTHSDRVYMLEGSRFVESGAYAELAAAAGPFAELNAALVGEHKEVEKDSTTEGEALASIMQERKPEDVTAEDVVNLKDAKDSKGEDDASEAASGEAKPPEEMGKMDTQRSSARRSSMTVEMKNIGHVGVSDFLVIAKASDSFCLALAVIFFSILPPIMKYVVNFALAEWSTAIASESSNASESEEKSFLLMYLITAAGFTVMLLVRSCLMVEYFVRSSRRLHRGMLNTILRQPMGWFDSTPIGRILNRFAHDCMNMDYILPLFMQQITLNMGTLIVAVVMASIFVPPSLVLSIFLCVTFLFLYRRYGEVAVDIQRVNMISIGPLTGAFSGFLGALDTIRAFGRVQVFVNKFVGFQTDFIKSFYWQYTLDRAIQLLVVTPLITIFVGAVGTIMVALVQNSDVLGNIITPARAGLTIALANALSFVLPFAVMLAARVEQAVVATQRINEYKSLPWEPGSRIQKVGFESGADQEWINDGELKMSDIRMRYAQDLPIVLDGVSFEARPGQKVAIVGRTGSGKSSLILVVFRMVQLEGGSVHIGSSDISKLTLPALRGNLGIIPQDCWMFSGTLRSNLDVASAYTDEQLWDALKLVQLEEQVKAFEDGLDHEVQEKGDNISMGTRQLLCLARVLLKKPKLIFMDEATASVDVKTDLVVQQTIRKSFSESTIVTIAHRLNTIIDFDRVAVMNFGKLVEYDSPHSLLSKADGHFTSLVRDSGNEAELRQRAFAAHEQVERGNAIGIETI